MFESIFNGISEFFSDLLPTDFCVPCFLKGVVEGLAIGLATLAVIAALPAELAVIATVGLVALGVYGIVQLCNKWDSMTGEQKSEAAGNIVGGIIAGKVGPTTPAMPLNLPSGVRLLTTPQGETIPVILTTQASIATTGAVGTAAGAGTAMLMTGGSGGGSDDKGPYSDLDDPSTVGPGKDFTPAQKAKIIEANKARNGGVVKSDDPNDYFQDLTKPAKSQKGVTPSPDEWQIDHIEPKDKGGSNSFDNARVISRKLNREKSNN